MGENSVVSFRRPERGGEDGLTAVIRAGARRPLEAAVEEEVREFLMMHEDRRLADGRRAVVRNDYLPEREIQTGLGAVEVKVPKVRDRFHEGVKFNSKLLPPYLRRAPSVEAAIPWLYLKGVSTGDFQEALAALLGAGAAGLSPSTVSRLKGVWEKEYDEWRMRSFEQKRYVYLWADGVYFNVRLEEARQCLLVVIGVDEYGRKEFLAIEDGYRESAQS